MGWGIERQDRGGNMERDNTNDLLEEVIWKDTTVELPKVYTHTCICVSILHVCM